MSGSLRIRAVVVIMIASVTGNSGVILGLLHFGATCVFAATKIHSSFVLQDQQESEDMIFRLLSATFLDYILPEPMSHLIHTKSDNLGL